MWYYINVPLVASMLLSVAALKTQSGQPDLRKHPLSLKYPVGGVSLCDPAIKKEFDLTGVELIGCSVARQCTGTYASQIPGASLEFFKDGQVEWSQAHTDKLVNLVRAGHDISPPDYPYAVPDLQEALERAMNSAGLRTSARVLVAGSISPWVEATLAASGINNIFTMDWDPRSIQSNITKLVLRKDVPWEATGLYDAVVSFSSIEHDGLGRYCDPINPEGDRAAMQEFYRWLTPDGVLLLGFPVGEEAVIYGNGHRFYDKRRFFSIAEGFDLLHTCKKHHGKEPWTGARSNTWTNQPFFVLRKNGASPGA